ncbi:MAG TPA: response regulator [Blastocatellia bacterium]|nr:response regulator [Blastocatellia bacterium]
MENAKGRILCVDDDEDACEMMNALLDLQGYEVIQAQNIAEGLSQGITNNLDLILLDWVFQDGTGIDLCKMLRSTGVSAPILFYSGARDGADIETAMRAGAQGFLIKPVDSAGLFHSLSQFLGNPGINIERSAETS